MELKPNIINDIKIQILTLVKTKEAKKKTNKIKIISSAQNCNVPNDTQNVRHSKIFIIWSFTFLIPCFVYFAKFVLATAQIH